MIAYVYEGMGKLSLKDVSAPELKNDNAIVKVNACSICGTDLRTYLHGSKKILPPRVIGHEFSGTILEVGNNIKGFKSGERVAVAPAIGCGKCYLCSKGNTNMCDNLKTIGFQYDGCFAEYIEIPLHAFEMGNVSKLSDFIEDEEAALAEPIACALNGQEFLNIKQGDYVAIFGAGFIGCIHAELAFKNGASKVIIIEMAEKRVKQVKELIPQVNVINPKTSDTYEEVMKITEGRGADVVIVACSSGKAQEEGIKISSKRGRISLFGGLPGQSKGFIDSNQIHYKELSVCGVHASTPSQNKKVLDWISHRNLNVKKYISNVYSLKDIEEAFEAIKSENVLKAIIKPFKNKK